MTLELASDLEEFLQKRLATRAYKSGEELLRKAFDLLEQREQLLDHIDRGTIQLKSGQFTDYDANSLKDFCEEIKADGWK